jgi:DNA-directed RNA polymerase, mitochondrial
MMLFMLKLMHNALQALAEKTAQVAAAKAAQRGHAAAAKAIARNRDLHSLRSDLLIKLGIADQFVGRDMFFPHNLDFRGRAYPIPPNLNHMGNDFTRGVLRFAEAKRLGPRGLYWLKVQVREITCSSIFVAVA